MSATIWDGLDPLAAPALRYLIRPDGDRHVFLLGAFDPPTLAHESVLLAAARLAGGHAVFCMTKVLLDRPDDQLLHVTERLALLEELAGATGAGVAVSNRGRYLDVARAARGARVQAVFVIGSDKLAQIQDPRFYEDGPAGVAATFEEAEFVVVPRGAHDVTRPGVAVLDAAEVFTDTGLSDLSASTVRERVRSGEPVHGLVSPIVAEHLRRYTERTEAR